MEAFGVFDYNLLDFVVHIAERGARWKPAALKFALNATLRVFPQINDKLVRHAAFHIKQEHVVIWQILAVYGLDGLKYAALQKPAQLATINRIARETVYLPAQDTTRLAIFDALHDLIENWTVIRLLGRLRLGVDFLDVQIQGGGKLLEPIHLVINRLHLPIFALGRLAGV